MQATSHILLIRPAGFGFNTETAGTNAFQNHLQESNTQRKALEEFDAVAATLRAAGIQVIIFEDTKDPLKPDAIFPNNWISLHADGTIVLYPMLAPNRRIEKRPDIVEYLGAQFAVSNVLDLSAHEAEGVFLEGTGSIVFDHVNRVAYAAISPRTSKRLFIQLAEHLGYKPVLFQALDEQGKEVYHTNVVMCVGNGFAVICADCIADEAEKNTVIKCLADGGLEIIYISRGQMNSFAGNMLALRSKAGENILILSQTAFDSLEAAQRAVLSKYCRLLPLFIPTIETIGGGSARCMIAEIFLPARQ
jgi:hypothetical protein